MMITDFYMAYTAQELKDTDAFYYCLANPLSLWEYPVQVIFDNVFKQSYVKSGQIFCFFKSALYKHSILKIFSVYLLV